ncbi:MAG TPA: helix-turn-helix transcriptional regulator [Candidatus Limnocylindrales bacterium]
MDLTPTSIHREAARQARRIWTHAGEDVRRLRLDANVSGPELSRAVGIDPAHLWRIEAGLAHPSLEVLVAIGVALGADLGVRYFAGAGPRIHDRFQAPMLEKVVSELHPRWRPQLEVVVTRPARGVIDLVLHDTVTETVVASELHSDLRRIEQQLRWANEKADGLATLLDRPISRLLILRSTVRTRELARQYEGLLRIAYPARCADAVDALITGAAPWPGPSIVWVHLHGSTATLMRHPPRRVHLGR